MGGGVLFPEEKAREALRFCHEFASTCPDELSISTSLGRTPDGGVPGVDLYRITEYGLEMLEES